MYSFFGRQCARSCGNQKKSGEVEAGLGEGVDVQKLSRAGELLGTLKLLFAAVSVDL